MMAWQFERVAGPCEGPAGGVVRDGDAVVFSTIDEGKLWRFDPASKAATEVRRYTNRVNGLARGPGGELYGAQEGGRRLVEFTSDGRMVAVDALLDGKYHNQPSDLVVDRKDRKSTRLNSSHLGNSYAGFCLKKKKKKAARSRDETESSRTAESRRHRWYRP